LGSSPNSPLLVLENHSRKKARLTATSSAPFKGVPGAGLGAGGSGRSPPSSPGAASSAGSPRSVSTATAPVAAPPAAPTPSWRKALAGRPADTSAPTLSHPHQLADDTRPAFWGAGVQLKSRPEQRHPPVGEGGGCSALGGKGGRGCKGGS